MSDPITLEPHDEAYKTKVIFDGEHIANIHHSMRHVLGGGQSSMQPIWVVHPPEHKPEHFGPKTCTSLNSAKHCAIMSSLEGDLRKI